MLLRQYKRARNKKRSKFSYKDIQAVYTIVLFEKSPADFYQFPQEYIHSFRQESNTGLQMELLQKYFFIPLDIFDQNRYNKPINNRLDAWLVFLSMDDPGMILRLIDSYPEFKPLYEQVYGLCQNVERVMEMFSEELQEKGEQLQGMDEQLQEQKRLLEDAWEQITQLKLELSKK